jgi:hypothetical protein
VVNIPKRAQRKAAKEQDQLVTISSLSIVLISWMERINGEPYSISNLIEIRQPCSMLLNETRQLILFTRLREQMEQI